MRHIPPAGAPQGLHVPVSPILIETLTVLSDALDDPDINLESTLVELADDLTVSIPLYLGLTITVQVDEHLVNANTLDPESTMAIASSLTLPLLSLGAASATGSVILYSGARGVFTAIGRDARWIFNLDGPPVVDDHISSTSAPSNPTRHNP